MISVEGNSEMPETCQIAKYAEPKRSVMPWLAIVAALGLSTAALVIASKARAASAGPEANDLLDLCEQAASQLDARLSVAS